MPRGIRAPSHKAFQQIGPWFIVDSVNSATTLEETMTDKKKPVRVELTEEQRKEMKKDEVKETQAGEFTVEELEERIAPVRAL